MQVVIILAQRILNNSAYVIISATSEARNDKNLFYVVSSTYVHRVLLCTSAVRNQGILPLALTGNYSKLLVDLNKEEDICSTIIFNLVFPM